MNNHKLRGLALCGLLSFGLHNPVTAQEGFLGFGGSQDTPSISLAATQITMDVPTPVQGNDLAFLLAQAGGGGGLTELKQQAAQKFSAFLREELHRALRDYFADEKVPLVEQGGYLTLHNFAKVSVSKQLNDLKTSSNYELERGTLKLSGEFHYRLDNLAGNTLREQRIDLADLRVRESYKVKTPHGDGELEDTTDAAIEEALAEMVERIIDRIEDQLEADELRQLAAI